MAKPDIPPAEEIDGGVKTGRVFYWNGASGWIAREGVENLCTAEAGRVSLAENFLDNIDTSEIKNGVRVSFVTTKGMHYIARSVQVIAEGEVTPQQQEQRHGEEAEAPVEAEAQAEVKQE